MKTEKVAEAILDCGEPAPAPVQEKLGSKEEEDAVYAIWTKDYERNQRSKAEMAREIGKPAHYVSDKISAFEQRKGLNLPRADASKLSTHDIL